MPIRRNPGIEILLHFRWGVAAGTLTTESLAKLGPYVLRYAETLNIRVHAVGGVADHLHLLADLPPDMPADRFSKELQAPTARYLRDVQGAREFAWNTDAVAVVSISPSERDGTTAYIAGQESHHASGDLKRHLEETDAPTSSRATPTEEELPDWLTSALH